MLAGRRAQQNACLSSPQVPPWSTTALCRAVLYKKPSDSHITTFPAGIVALIRVSRRGIPLNRGRRYL